MTGKKPRSLTIHDLRGVIETLLPGAKLEMLSLDAGPLAVAAKLNAKFVETSGEKKQVNSVELGLMGQCPPAIAREIGYETVFVAELSLASVERFARRPRKYLEISPYPAITRDVALEIDASVANQAVGSFFDSYKEPLLEHAALFDVFSDPSGQKLDATKKSLAYTLTYRSKSKTLEAKTVDKAHAKILKALQDKLGVTIR